LRLPAPLAPGVGRARLAHGARRHGPHLQARRVTSLYAPDEARHDRKNPTKDVGSAVWHFAMGRQAASGWRPVPRRPRAAGGAAPACCYDRTDPRKVAGSAGWLFRAALDARWSGRV
jgi:hypothetical protein